MRYILREYKTAKKTMHSRILKIEADGDPWTGKTKPKIRLKGRWLERSGFKPGNLVSVEKLLMECLSFVQ